MRQLTKSMLVMVMMVLFLTACTSPKNETPAPSAATDVTLRTLQFSGYDLHQPTAAEMPIVLEKDINVVSIWQNPCPPCKIEADAMEMLQQKYPDVGFIGLCVAESSEDALAATRAWGLTYRNYRLGETFYQDIKDQVTRTPALFIVDRDGKELVPMTVGLDGTDPTPESVVAHLEEVLKGLRHES